MIAHVDLDAVKYAAASVGETRSVHIVHKVSGDEYTVPNKTAWYGRGKKKDGGMLAELNKALETPMQWEDFTYTDVQIPDPPANIMRTAKAMVDRMVAQSGANSANYYIGQGDSFRVEYSTLLKYKGQRASGLRPVMLDEVTDFLIRKYSAEIIRNYEVDDIVVMNSYGKRDHFIVGVDKDYLGSGSNFFDANTPELGIQKTSGFGQLHLTGKDKVRGVGRMFKMWQACAQDSTDNYAANCFSKVKWADKSAYHALKDCTNDKDLFQAAVNVFKKLYPAPVEVIGWRGEPIKIDWLYVFNECFNLAHMHRKKNDFVNVADVLTKLEIMV